MALLSNRDRLATALHAEHKPDAPMHNCVPCYRTADHLLASGAVVDPVANEAPVEEAPVEHATCDGNGGSVFHHDGYGMPGAGETWIEQPCPHCGSWHESREDRS